MIEYIELLTTYTWALIKLGFMLIIFIAIYSAIIETLGKKDKNDK